MAHASTPGVPSGPTSIQKPGNGTPKVSGGASFTNANKAGVNAQKAVGRVATSGMKPFSFAGVLGAMLFIVLALDLLKNWQAATAIETGGFTLATGTIRAIQQSPFSAGGNPSPNRGGRQNNNTLINTKNATGASGNF